MWHHTAYTFHGFSYYTTVNVLKFWTLVACQKGQDKQCRSRVACFWWSSLIRGLAICYSDKHFVNFSPENQLFIWEQTEKCLKFKNIYHNLIINPRRSRRDIVLASSLHPSILFVCPEPYLGTYWSDLIHSWYKW